MTGQIMKLEAALLGLPLIVTLIYKDSSPWPFLTAIGAALVLGFLMTAISRPKDRTMFAREGFVIVSFAWVMVSLVGCIPFIMSGDIPNFADAFFEIVSGFTTTGATVVEQVDLLSHGVLFWRSFTHFIGGMGVLVLIMAILPTDSGRSMHIMRAEMPGPVVGKLVPKVKDTAKILYRIYIVMTLVETVLLICGGMSVFDSIVHAFGTAGTGGFGIKPDSLASYSPYCQWVISIFMLLFGVNFNLYYLLLVGKIKDALKSEELWFYLGIVAAASVGIALNIYKLCSGISETIRASVFQTSAFITTTGYSTADFNAWPGGARGILFVLLFLGGCAGSTAGGLKLSRLILMFKAIRRDLKKLVHPHSVSVIKFEGKRVDDETINGVTSYFALYMGCMAIAAILLCLFEDFTLESNLTASVSCFNNVGPYLGNLGLNGSYADYSAGAKLLLSLEMLMGRLEVYPLIIALSPSTWRRS